MCRCEIWVLREGRGDSRYMGYVACRRTILCSMICWTSREEEEEEDRGRGLITARDMFSLGLWWWV